MPTIDYLKISDAIAHYKRLGYEYIDAPWFVSRESMEITSPKGPRFFTTFAGELVASGEQSFLEIRKTLKPGRYLCATPCFRDEPKHDELHLQSFFKVELIHILNESFDANTAVQTIASDAFFFFKKYTHRVDFRKTDVGLDIDLNGIEIGSYGYREHGDFKWVYGTGIAEPRFTHAFDLPTKNNGLARSLNINGPARYFRSDDGSTLRVHGKHMGCYDIDLDWFEEGLCEDGYPTFNKDLSNPSIHVHCGCCDSETVKMREITKEEYDEL